MYTTRIIVLRPKEDVRIIAIRLIHLATLTIATHIIVIQTTEGLITSPEILITDVRTIGIQITTTLITAETQITATRIIITLIIRIRISIQKIRPAG